MSVIADLVSWVLIATGCFFMVTGGIGLVRLPDLYARFHAAGITDTAGAGLILVGVMVQAGFTLLTVKLIFILLFILFTSPTATHALARAARHDGLVPWLRRRPPDAESKSSSS
jgi:multicomponent Na+:H+ antiporter subunit G